MNTFIPLASPDIREDDIKKVVEVLRSGQLVQGKYVEELELKISNLFNFNYSIMLSNGTATLHLILIALGIGKGDEVIVPAFSYIATANVVELVGAKSIFVDINQDTFNIDQNLVEKYISKRTKAIIVVHEFGLAADTDVIKNICKKYNIFLIEDAACALGAKDNDKYVGNFGIAGSFSFHPRKAITSGEGGVVVTNDRLFSDKIRALRNHGIDPNENNFNDFILPGFNYRVTDFQAALLIGQLDRIKSNLDRRNFIANRYLNEINHPEMTFPVIPEEKSHSWQTFYLMTSDNLDRDEIIKKMKNEGIGTNYGAQCIPLQSFYYKKYNLNSEIEFPNAYRSFKKGLAIPIYEKLNDDQVSYIIDKLNSIHC